MKIVVVGGSGLIGRKPVKQLRERVFATVPASLDDGVNTITGEGLAAVVEGASVVVDVSNSPSFEEGPAFEFFDTSTRNIVEAETAAGVGHHVVLSVIGADRLADSGYLRAKSPRKADRGLSDSLLDRSRDAVLRVHREHR